MIIPLPCYRFHHVKLLFSMSFLGFVYLLGFFFSYSSSFCLYYKEFMCSGFVNGNWCDIVLFSITFIYLLVVGMFSFFATISDVPAITIFFHLLRFKYSAGKWLLQDDAIWEKKETISRGFECVKTV